MWLRNILQLLLLIVRMYSFFYCFHICVCVCVCVWSASVYIFHMTYAIWIKIYKKNRVEFFLVCGLRINERVYCFSVIMFFSFTGLFVLRERSEDVVYAFSIQTKQNTFLFDLFKKKNGFLLNVALIKVTNQKCSAGAQFSSHPCGPPISIDLLSLGCCGISFSEKFVRNIYVK